MKIRASFLFLAILVSLPLFAAPETPERYIVVTREAVAPGFAAEVAALPDGKRFKFQRFEFVNGFAADLLAEEVRDLQRDPEVLYVERDPERWALALTPVPAATPLQRSEAIPYGVKAVGAPWVWDKIQGQGVNVAVVDTGIEISHPDLAAAYRGGANFVEPNKPPLDDHGHGTHVAGTIAARENGVGVVGVAPLANIYAYKVLNQQGKGSGSNIIAALELCIKSRSGPASERIDVVNLSLGGPENSQAEEYVFQRARNSGLTVIAAAGNNGETENPSVLYPAAYPSVIAVGAVDQNLARANFSNYGPQLTIVAPGVDITSSTPFGKGSFSGVESLDVILPARAMEYSLTHQVTARVVYCGYGTKTSDFPPEVRGNIALLKRGGEETDSESVKTFAAKTLKAVAAGAAAVLMFNNRAGSFAGTLQSPSALWPVVLSLSQADGENLIGVQTPITVYNVSDDYGQRSGTSMAAPHASGLAALLLSAEPESSPRRIEDALAGGARDLPPAGWDAKTGYGAVNVETAWAFLIKSKDWPVRRRSVSR